jgi:putative hydrolase of the HAD superfamily
MIRAAFFDFDGVLTLENSGTDSTCEALAAKKHIPYEPLKAALRPLIKKLALVPDSYQSILKPLNDTLQTDITEADLLEAASTTRPNSDMYTLVEELRHSGLETGIITDNTVERMGLLRETFKLADFSPVIVSAEVGTAKWQGAEIFKIALERAGVQPDEAIFIDNTKENLLPATELGIHTYRHDDKLNDLSALRLRLVDLGVSL